MGETDRSGAVERVDVVVVGGGLAGLTAARDLDAGGLLVIVVEAQDRVGGRVLNHTLSNGSIVELGGQWVGPTQDRVLALAADLGVELFPSYDAGDGLLSLDGEIVPLTEDTLGLADEPRNELTAAMKVLDDMALTIPLVDPWTAAEADRWDRQTLETWIDGNVVSPQAKAMLRGLVPAVFGAEAWDMSLLHFLYYLHSGGLIDRIISTSGGAQESRIRGGSQILATQLADRLGAMVRLGAPVDKIAQSDELVQTTVGGTTITSRRVIVSASPALALRIGYAPPLPPLRDQLMQKVPMGYVIKCMAVYDEPFWRDAGLSGFAFDPGAPILEIHDNSPDDASCGVLVGFAEGRQGRLLGQLTPEDRIASALGAFERFFGAKAARSLEYVEKDWAADEWARGCYGGHLSPGVWTQYGPALREPCGLIHWAGAETSSVWNGYMDGAIRSGERAAAEVIQASF